MKLLATCSLSHRVMAVAVQRHDGWCAYIDNVLGFNHQEEANHVMKNGTKLLKCVAESIFQDRSSFTGDYVM